MQGAFSPEEDRWNCMTAPSPQAYSSYIQTKVQEFQAKRQLVLKYPMLLVVPEEDFGRALQAMAQTGGQLPGNFQTSIQLRGPPAATGIATTSTGPTGSDPFGGTNANTPGADAWGAQSSVATPAIANAAANVTAPVGSGAAPTAMSQEDEVAFRSQHFQFGKIPEVPPPAHLIT
jgi:hypothetical protein